MPVNYSSATNTITVTGYSAATPCNFTDIYNADVAGSWGVVTRQCTNQFCIASKIVIGDGSTTTYFADEKQQVKWTNAITTANYQNVILVKTNGSCRFGKLIDGTKKITRDGCQHSYHANAYRVFFIMCEASAELLIYGSSFISSTYTPYALVRGLDGTTEIYNSNFNGVGLGMFTAIDMYNVVVEYVEYGIYSVSGTVDTVKVHNTTVYGLLFYNIVATLKNVVHKAKISGSAIRAGNVTGNCYLINCELDSWDISWGGTGYPVIYRQYERDLSLVDSTGTGIDTAKVKFWDSDDSLVTNLNTNTSGVLATQTLNRGYYQQSSGSTITTKTPHESRIYKYGKLMLSSKSDVETKTDWAFTMLADTYITQTTEATVAAYTGITINHTTETITISTNHTLDEIYDYCQYDIIAATKQLDQTMHTADGVNFISEYSFVVNTGITVTATDQKLSMVSGETYTLTGTAQFTGIIATTTTTRIPIKLTNIVDGSRYWVGTTSSMVKIFDGTQSGTGDVTGYYEHTADTPITIRVRKGSSSPKYLNHESFGTLYAAAAAFMISQVVDSIA